MVIKNVNLAFLKSALDKTEVNSALEWINNQNKAVNVSVKKVDFEKLEKWKFDQKKGCIGHDTGSFFSIDGIRVNTTLGKVGQWDQPIINQPEVGFLGFLVKEINGVLHFLVQAKIEPGNVNFVQLSPTLQATRSNFQQAHNGKQPKYLEYFKNATEETVLIDQLQSEQGARFLKKRNRNIIISANDNIEVYENFTWLTLGQLKSLMQVDNIVNMDTRTVLSGILYGNYNKKAINFSSVFTPQETYKSMLLKSALSSEGCFNSLNRIFSFITDLKSNNDLLVKKIPFNVLKDWIVTKDEIYHKDNDYFKIIGVEVEISNREVLNWYQPMVEPAQEGLCAFVCKNINGLLHFAVQAKLECGNHDIFEFAPTVQTLTGSYKKTPKDSLPFLEYVLSAKKEQIVYDTIQSEEGGRFFKEQNRNILIIADDDLPQELPENFIWMTLNQINNLTQYNNYINIQARNLIASIPFV
tara:strand:+ start:4322 stop:5728 length:1407 start_codon:yes stop_codon:yes gene_type:complete